jgi:exodeoxyribonuclease-3
LKIATWNVNSVRQRTGHLVRYLREARPDVLCLQELKCLEAQFPYAEVEAEGYNAAVHGQKSFNGVAILAKTPIELAPGLPGGPAGEEARYIEAVIPWDKGIARVASIYLPNGNPPQTEKYTYKLDFIDRLAAHAAHLLALEEPLVLAGDYNVIPTPGDCADPAAWEGDALFLPEVRARFRCLLHLGLTDAVRATTDDPSLYTFWDYQGASWQRNKGIRIDHMLLSPLAADRLARARIDKARRGEDKPSDHVPVEIELV